MKRKKIAITIVFILLSIVILPVVDATDLATNELLQMNGKTITKTTTLSQVNSMFGNPKIETENAFGGISCSYYDDNYSYYLYIETNSSDKIVGYGAIGGNFIGKRYAQGDENDNYYWYLSGTAVYNNHTSEIYGIMEYNCDSTDTSTYWTNYQNNSSKYLYELQKHSAIASRVVAVMNGDAFTQTYADEDIFYMNEQLKYNGSNFYEYANNSGKTKQISFIKTGIKDYYADLPNPIYFGSTTRKYIKASNYKYILYDLEMTDYTSSTKIGTERIIYIDPSFIEEKQKVELTDEEKTKLEAAKAEYAKYTEHGQQITNLYEEKPNYTSLPLSAGKYSTVALQAMTDYLNVARAGLGIGTLKLNEEIADCAQHKATLVYYMNSQNMSTGHFPTQPDGVSDEFYNKAQSYMNENLYSGTIQTSITLALNDGYGDPVTCGHRYNLIDPGYTEWGIGSVGSGISWGWQGCHKFSGYADYSNELVAWPSNGITPIDMIGNGIGNWTAKFYKNYTTSSDTTVTVKCLNSGKTYEITKTSSADGKFLSVPNSKMVTFRDDNITYENGDVFEITLHNMKDSDGNTTDYTYRSVFYQFYNSSNVEVTDISLNKNSVTLSMGGSQRVLAKVVPDDASLKLMTFKSEDESIAKVRQDGTITGVKEGKTTIKVDCQDVTKTITVNVTKYLIGDINGDGIVNGNDVNYGMRGIVNKIALTDLEKEIGDVNGDGIFNGNDINMMMRFIVGKIEEF
jgi:uncharacterized protein YjdB/uncharacterized protein YkwD